MTKKVKTTFDQLTDSGRSELMSKIKSKDTKPELLLRKILHRDGLRYRKHKSDLPGKPDISIKKYKVIVDVRGCFWHGHSNCPDGHTPRKNSEFWIKKLNANKKRDETNLEKYQNMGYKVFIFWECEIRNKQKLEDKLFKLYEFLNNSFGISIPTNNKQKK